MLLVTLSITKSHVFQLEKQNTTNASEEVLYNNTHFNLLQLEIILQSRLKVEFGRSTCKNPEMVPLAHGPWEIRGKKQVTHLQYIRLQSKKIKLIDGKFLKKDLLALSPFLLTPNRALPFSLFQIASVSHFELINTTERQEVSTLVVSTLWDSCQDFKVSPSPLR